MVASGVSTRIALLACPSARIPDRSERREIDALVELFKHFLKDRELHAIEHSSHGRAAFKTYSSDGTPIQVSVAFRRTVGSPDRQQAR